MISPAGTGVWPVAGVPCPSSQRVQFGRATREAEAGRGSGVCAAARAAPRNSTNDMDKPHPGTNRERYAWYGGLSDTRTGEFTHLLVVSALLSTPFVQIAKPSCRLQHGSQGSPA